MILTEAQTYELSSLEENDKDFLLSLNLITINGSRFKSNFVGKVITPTNSIYSVPKNFKADTQTTELIDQILDHYRDLKLDGRTLLLNNTFKISPKGYKSEKFYFNELKETFLDFITYEFISPEKKLSKHSTTPLGSKIDVFNTIKKRKQVGIGVTYKIKDLDNPNWKLGDIYWSVIEYLAEKYGNSDDKSQINEMKEFLLKEGFKIKTINITNNNNMIEEIEKSNTGIIHNSIKETLLEYFKSCAITENYEVKIFYTRLFQNVWETIIRIALYHDKEFQEELEPNFQNVIRTSKFLPKNKIVQFLRDNPGYGDHKSYYDKTINRVVYFHTSLKPDIFSSHVRNGIRYRFIGDAKYYNDINDTYDKEREGYNNAMDNQYPMCIFAPSNVTRVHSDKRDNDLNQSNEIIIFEINIATVIQDSINIKNGRKSTVTIDRVLDLIPKYTNRGDRDINGFDNIFI